MSLRIFDRNLYAKNQLDPCISPHCSRINFHSTVLSGASKFCSHNRMAVDWVVGRDARRTDASCCRHVFRCFVN